MINTIEAITICVSQDLKYYTYVLEFLKKEAMNYSIVTSVDTQSS